MDAEAAFLLAAVPEPRILLHQRLKPYGLGHEMILRRLRSPFLCSEPCESGQLEQRLFTAVFVCCSDFDEALAGLADGTLPAKFHRWRKLCGKLDLDDVVRAFLQYLKDGRLVPEYYRTPSRGSASRPGAPFLLLLWQCLTGRLGFSRSEALACPFGLARWHYCAQAESVGGAQIRTGALDAARAAMRAAGWEPMRVQAGRS